LRGAVNDSLRSSEYARKSPLGRCAPADLEPAQWHEYPVPLFQGVGWRPSRFLFSEFPRGHPGGPSCFSPLAGGHPAARMARIAVTEACWPRPARGIRGQPGRPIGVARSGDLVVESQKFARGVRLADPESGPNGDSLVSRGPVRNRLFVVLCPGWPLEAGPRPAGADDPET
jgi:hypothetical protein